MKFAIRANKHNWNCPGNCRHEIQCELDACWQRLEEALEWDNLKRAGNHPDQKKLGEEE